MRKRIAAIHDLASYGGAALMNIIPIMYSKGIEVNPIPTVLFTSHGGFKGSMRHDNDKFMEQYTSQWTDLGINFNGIYLGLFASKEQVLSALRFVDAFSKPDCLIVLDPILGDNGKLYSFMDADIIQDVRHLLRMANIITPNLTEACLLLGREYSEDATEADIKFILEELASMGPDNIILTSVPNRGLINNYIYNKNTSYINVVSSEKLPGSYPGTGDAFTSFVMAEILNGAEIYESVLQASKFIENGIKIILEKDYYPLEGLPLAQMLTFNNSSVL